MSLRPDYSPRRGRRSRRAGEFDSAGRARIIRSARADRPPRIRARMPRGRRRSVHNDYLVVDADGHVVEPPYVWTERMDKEKWGDLIPHRISNYEPGKHAWFVGGEIRGLGGGAVGSAAGMDI